MPKHPVPLPALLAVVLWGASFVAVDLALGSLTPFGLTSVRLALGALVLAGVQRARAGSLVPRAGDRGLCALLGLVLAAHLSIQAYGLVYTSAVHTGWIIGFTPVALALGAQLFLRERLRALGWVGVALAAAGVVVITLEDPGELVHARWGDLLQLLSCVTWAVYSLVAVPVVARNGALVVAGWSMGVASVCLLPAAAYTGFGSGVTLGAVFAVLYLGVFCNAVAFVLWYRSQRVHGAQRTGATLYLEPFSTLLFAVLLLNESVGLNAVVGGLVVLLGVWFVGKGEDERT